MSRLRLYAIGIDDFRDLFRAPEPAAELRQVAVRLALVPPDRRQGRTRRRDDPGPSDLPRLPTPEEVDALLAGRYLQPPSLAPAWLVLEEWLAVTAWGNHHLDLGASGLSGLDFSLARLGVPARFGLQQVLKTDLGVPLRAAPGMAAGFAVFDHTIAMATAWHEAGDDGVGLDPDKARPILTWLDNFPRWAVEATSSIRPRPDLIAILSE